MKNTKIYKKFNTLFWEHISGEYYLYRQRERLLFLYLDFYISILLFPISF